MGGCVCFSGNCCLNFSLGHIFTRFKSDDLSSEFCHLVSKSFAVNDFLSEFNLTIFEHELLETIPKLLDWCSVFIYDDEGKLLHF